MKKEKKPTLAEARVIVKKMSDTHALDDAGLTESQIEILALEISGKISEEEAFEMALADAKQDESSVHLS